MPPTRLADTRQTASLQDAEAIMRDIRKLTCERDVIVARAEKRIAAISNDAQIACGPLDSGLMARERQLTEFILANRHLFEKKRAHECPDGQFGLRAANRLVVTDGDKLLDHILDCSYDDCVKIVRSLIKPSIAKRIKAGEDMPGAAIQSGDLAFCQVNKALVKEAVENAAS